MIFAVAGFAAMIMALMLVAVSDVNCKRSAAHFEERYRESEKEIELLLNHVSSLTMEAARHKERIDMLEDRIKEMDKKIDDAAQVQEEAAAAIAKQIEKKWDNGLQNMLAWNPFDVGSEGN